MTETQSDTLRWSLTLDGPPLVVAPNLRTQLPRIARVGEEDGLVVYGRRGARGPELVSHRIRRLFSGIPDVGSPTVHSTKDNFNSMGALVAWPDGSFAASYGGEWVLGASETPGARATLGRGHVFDPASDALFVLQPEGGRTQVLRRATRHGDGHVDDCGSCPKGGIVAAEVGAEGALFLAVLVEPTTMQILVASPSGITAGLTLAAPKGVRFELLRRSGGATLIVASNGANVVHRLDASGQPCSEPWTLPRVAASDHLVASTAWRDGVALASTRGSAGVGLAVTDGTRAGFSEATLRGVVSSHLLGGLAASVDGAALALTYYLIDRAGQGGILLARFRYSADESASPFVPTAETAGRSVDSLPSSTALVVAPQAAAPPQPLSPRTVRPSPFGTRDVLVRFFRRLSLKTAFVAARGWSVFPDAQAEGTTQEGFTFGSNGAGDHFVAHWDATGIVLLGFDHESPESEWEIPLDRRDPGRHLPNVPPELASVALRATDWGERLATEGLWIAAGGAHGGSTLDVLHRFFGQGVEDLGRLFNADDPLDGLVARVAALDTYAVTASDEALIFANSGPPNPPLANADVERGVAELARLGVTWPDAVAHAAALRDAQTAKREAAVAARISAADRELLLATHGGDREGVERALANGAALNARMPDGFLPRTYAGATPLLVAMHQGHGEIAELLIERGADVEVRVPASHGAGTALRAAAAQGDIKLLRLLRARGASVEADQGGSWGLLQAVCYPRGHLTRGTPIDYAEVIRLLLDAGAPLPNDAHCEILVGMVREAGANDLIPRLRRVYAEDALPALPPPIDPSVAPRVGALIEQAAEAFSTDNALSLRLLIEAWQLDPLPALGDVVETLARRIRGAHPGYEVPARGGIDGAATLRALQQALQAPPDPRSARALLRWLQTSDIYTDRPALARCIDAAAALLVHARDVRCAEGLAQHCELRPTGVGPTREALRVALLVLQETRPVPLDAAGAKSLARLEDALAGRRTMPGAVSTRAMFDAVYDDPDDDAPRHVLADRLIEAGDPRGELIALQLARHANGGKPSKREKTLLAEHGRGWLGEIAPVLGDDWVFERGFLEQATTADAGQDKLAHSLPVLASGAGTQVEWSTVRRLSLWRHAQVGAAGLLRGPRLRALRVLSDVGPADVRDLLHERVWALDQLEFAYVRRLPMWASFGKLLESAIPESFPGLTRLRVPSGDGSFDWVARLAERLPSLRELSVALQAPAIAELGALARTRGLTRVRLLGPGDLEFEPESGTLAISIPGRMAPPLAAVLGRVLDRARGLGVTRVVARTPLRAKLEGDGASRAFVRRGERLELGPLLASAEALGVPFALEPEHDDAFAPNPTRAE